MAENVTLSEVEVVQRRVYEALYDSSPSSPLSEEEQDEKLARACAASCELLGRWVDSSAWNGLRPAGRGPIADVIPDWESVRPFLEPLGATLIRMQKRRPAVSGMPEIGDPAAYIDQLIIQTKLTGRRFRPFDREDLFADATDRIKALRSSVCGVAADFTKDSKKRALRRTLARSALKRVGGFLLTASLILAGVSPQALAHDVPVWAHEAVKVIIVHQAAQTAQPAVSVAPPQLGPQLG
jgi:hypothetical protein